MIRILHIIAEKLDIHSGIPYVVREISKNQFIQKDISIRVLSVKYPLIEISPIYYYYFDSKLKVNKFIDDFMPIIVIFHGLYSLEFIDIYKKLTDLNIKYIIQPHGSANKNAQYKSFFKKKIANFLYFNRFITKASGYIYLNLDEKKKTFFPDKKSLIIPNGIYLNNDLHLKNNQSDFNFFYLGRIDIYHKGLDIFLKNLAKIQNLYPKVNFTIYGSGNKKQLKKLNSLIKPIKCMNVNYAGPIDGEIKRKVLLDSSIMILPSRYEGFPITILEALNHGIPCLVSEGTNISDMLINNDVGWLIDYKNLENQLNQIISIYKEKRNIFQKNCYEVIKRDYEWKMIGEISLRKISNNFFQGNDLI